MISILVIAGAAALGLSALGCDGDAPPPEEKEKPKHEPGTGPIVGDASVADGPLNSAREALGNSFTLVVTADSSGTKGCGKIRVQDLRFMDLENAKSVAFTGEGRWVSFPPSFDGTGQPSQGLISRMGDFPVSTFSSDYPEYGELGLKYLVTGTFDLLSHQLRLTVQNVNLSTGQPAGQFLTPVYSSWADPKGNAVECLAKEAFENEVMVNVASREVSMEIINSAGTIKVCEPCELPVREMEISFSKVGM